MKKPFWICGKHTVLSAINNPKRKIIEIIVGIVWFAPRPSPAAIDIKR